VSLSDGGDDTTLADIAETISVAECSEGAATAVEALLHAGTVAAGGLCDDGGDWRQIPAADLRPPFPANNVTDYPQEANLQGLRAMKTTLDDLCEDVRHVQLPNAVTED
jgi:hypothetical protein